MHAEGVITSVSMAMCLNFAEEWKKGMYALRSRIPYLLQAPGKVYIGRVTQHSDSMKDLEMLDEFSDRKHQCSRYA